MDKGNTVQLVAAAALAAIGAYFRQLIIPVILLLIAMVLDYATGMASAWVKHELSSKTGLVGIVKKIGYMIAVAVAAVVDQVIAVAAEKAGVGVGVQNIFALLVTIWLILNECISILENLAEIGVPVPEFLLKIIQRLKKDTEGKGGGKDDDGT